MALPISQALSRIRIFLNGVVQGVGFRPFIYRCAKERGFAGFVENISDGVIIEVQGNRHDLNDFVKSILASHPSSARISDIRTKEISLADDADFVIKKSRESHSKGPLFPPDFSVCDDCLKELFDPSNRRYRYPFINCTGCGPRFTIIKGLPYDRPRTSMASFKMCPECLREYADPFDRRFHAEPNACPLCGPHICWTLPDGRIAAKDGDAIKLCGKTIKSGRIAAVKGVGGFHLMADASDDNAISLLRNRKARYEKPFAVLFPADKDDMLSYVKKEAFLSEDEKMAILSIERPIIILRRRYDSRLSGYVSPGLDTVGAFLPYSPLHYILLKDLKMPIVATSANFSDSPIIKDNEEAMERLKETADGFLLHNRDIVRRCDDSVIRVIAKRPVFIRRSRGYTPHVFYLPCKVNEPVLAVGGNQKVAIALGWEDKAVMSQHLGDLTTEEGKEAFANAIDDLTGFYNIKPARIVSDMHPDYISTKWALSQNGVKHIQVQHHHAHIAACMLDNNLTDKVLGVSWDGSGYGVDGTIWGGEFLIADYKSFERFCTFRKFRLLGGEQAVKEPRRALLAILYEMYGEDILRSQKICHDLRILFTEEELTLFLQMLKRGFNSPFTTSAGRVFDAAGSLLGICHKATYEGQGAMMLECRVGDAAGSAYPIEVKTVRSSEFGVRSKDHKAESIAINPELIFNWEPMFKAMIEGMSKGVDITVVAQNFHETLAQLILHVTKMARQEKDLNTVCLSGGVFQNKVLTERAVNLLKENGFNVYTHNAMPPNDGGISLGQLIIGGLQ